MSDNKKSIILVAGVSGAGKSTILNMLEDHGFFCIENLPYFLLEQTCAYLLSTAKYENKIAISLSSRSLSDQAFSFEKLEQTYGVSIKSWYVEADKNTLRKRYDETRRRHPFSSTKVSLVEAIDNEFSALELYQSTAQYHIDTTNLTTQNLRKLVLDKLSDKSSLGVQVCLFSFGFKYGTPRKVDYLFDVRSLPNPYWDKKLRLLTGKDQEVIDYLSDSQLVLQMIDELSEFLSKWCKIQQDLGKSYIDIGIGCTGGQHRSVYVVEQLALRLQNVFGDLIMYHRELTA